LLIKDSPPWWQLAQKLRFQSIAAGDHAKIALNQVAQTWSGANQWSR